MRRSTRWAGWSSCASGRVPARGEVVDARKRRRSSRSSMPTRAGSSGCGCGCRCRRRRGVSRLTLTARALAGRRRWAAGASALAALAALGQAPLGFWWATLAGAGAGWSGCLAARTAAGAAFWLGLVAGAGHFALALIWIVEPFLIDIARHGWMAPFAVVLLSGGPWPVLGRGGGWCARRLPARRLASSWPSPRWNGCAGVMLTGFPWAMVGPCLDRHAAGPAGGAGRAIGSDAGDAAGRRAAGRLAAGAGLAGAGAAAGRCAGGFGLWRLAQPLPQRRGADLAPGPAQCRAVAEMGRRPRRERIPGPPAGPDRRRARAPI